MTTVRSRGMAVQMTTPETPSQTPSSQGSAADKGTLDFEREKWQAAHDLERKKFEAENKARDRENDLKVKEQELRTREVDLKTVEVERSRLTNPLVIAIFSAAIAGLINAGLNWLNNNSQYQLEATKSTDTIALEDRKSRATLALERSKAESSRILEMLKAPDSDKVAENLNFLIDTGLVTDTTLIPKIRSYLEHRKPGTGPLLSQRAIPGNVAFNGECKDNHRIVCYFDSNEMASNCHSVPC
jgi:hypothetical protein